jgi:bacterioferritin
MNKKHAESNHNVAVQIDHATEIIDALIVAYTMEIESVINYNAASINLDGVRAQEIKEALKDEVKDELGHARQLGKRIHILGGSVPGSQKLNFSQSAMQPRPDSADVVSIIRGVIQAEDEAVEHYKKLIEMCDGVDYATQDLCIQLLGDEEEHRRNFQGYLKEYERRS